LKTIAAGKGDVAMSMQALAMCCFVSTTEPVDALNCIDLFEKQMRKSMRVKARAGVKKGGDKGRTQARDMLVAACAGWGLVATTVEGNWLSTTGFRRFLPLFRDLLEHESLSVKIAAGENIALLCEARGGVEGLGLSMGDGGGAEGGGGGRRGRR
jgi:hypothetical protein